MPLENLWGLLGGSPQYGGTTSGLDPSTFPEPPIPPGTDTSVPSPEGWGAGGYDSSGYLNKDNITQALGSLGAASKGAQSGAGKGAGAPQQAALGAGAGARQGQASLTPLLQLLMQNRNALLQSATAGPGGQARPQGLLGI